MGLGQDQVNPWTAEAPAGKGPRRRRRRETTEGRLAVERLPPPSRAKANAPSPKRRRGQLLPHPQACARPGEEAGAPGKEGAAERAREVAGPEDPATAPPRAALVGAGAGAVPARTTASAPLARWGCPTIANSVAPLRRARNTSPRTARRNRPMSIGDMGRLAHRRRALPLRGRIPRSRSVLPSSESWKPDWFMLRSS